MALAPNRSRCLLPGRNASINVPFRNLTHNIDLTNRTINLCQNFTRRTPIDPCGNCHISCIYKCVELIYVFGIVANLLVVSRVILDRKLRKPTYVAIACLALSDTLFLTSNFFQATEIIIRALTCPAIDRSSYVFESAPSNIISGISWFSSNLHLTILAILRYLMIVYPLKSNIYITNKRIILVSACIWISSTALYVLKYVIGKVTGVKPARSAETTAVVWLCGFLLPLVITSVLHVVKVRQLRQYSKGAYHIQTVHMKASIQRMSKVIIIVIALAASLPLPRFIFLLLQRLKYEFPSTLFLVHFRNITHFLYQLNNALNPIIYAFMSLTFRNSLRSMCKMRCCDKNNGNTQAITTPISSRKTFIITIADSPELKRQTTQI